MTETRRTPERADAVPTLAERLKAQLARLDLSEQESPSVNIEPRAAAAARPGADTEPTSERPTVGAVMVSFNKKEIMEIVNSYMKINNLNVKVFFGNSLVTTMGSNGLCLVGTPNYYREIRFRSLLDHEIGTHYIRGVN